MEKPNYKTSTIRWPVKLWARMRHLQADFRIRNIQNFVISTIKKAVEEIERSKR